MVLLPLGKYLQAKRVRSRLLYMFSSNCFVLQVLFNHHYIITVVLNPTTDSISDSVWRCQKYYYWCNNQNYDYGYDNRGCTHISNYICDGENHCINGIDEKYCDQTVSFSF
jgi:hypothetical protein